MTERDKKLKIEKWIYRVIEEKKRGRERQREGERMRERQREGERMRDREIERE